MKPIIYQVLCKDADFEWVGRAQSKKVFGGSSILFGKLLCQTLANKDCSYILDQGVNTFWFLHSLFSGIFKGNKGLYLIFLAEV